MRIFLMILIFAIGFSGFPVAAYAIDDAHCLSADAKAVDFSPAQDLAKDTQDSAQNKHTQDKNGGAQHVCFSCGHSCTAYGAVFLPSVMVVAPMIKEPFTVTHDDVKDSLPSYLKRPPKFTV